MGIKGKLAKDIAKRAGVKMPKQAKSKYRAVPTVVDGIRFHSKKEAAHYVKLKALLDDSKISSLVLQPRLPLHARDITGAWITVGDCVLDFKYADEVGLVHWVDVKGYDNALSKWKRKHAEIEHGIKIEIV